MGLSTIFKNQHKLPILQTLLLYLSLLAGVFYIANITLLNGDISSSLTLFENISNLIVFVLFLTLYVLITKDKKSIFIWQILVLFFVIFLIDLIVTLSSSTLFTYESIEVSISPFDKFKGITSAFVILSLTYIMFFLLPLHYHGKKTQLLVLSLLLIAVFVTIIISYAKEGVNYPNIFKKYDDSWYNYQYAAKSLFEHRNSYGAFLFIGLVASLYLNYICPKWFTYLVTGFIYLNLIFTLCKTALLLGALLILSYLIIRFILTFNDHKKRNLITLSIFVLFLVVGIVLVLTVPILKDGFTSIFLKFSNKNSEMRFDIQKTSLSILSPIDIIFGKGVTIYSKEVGSVLMSKGFGTTFTHNGYIYLLGSFGIFGLILFTLLLAFVIYNAAKLFKKDMWLSFLTLITLLSILVYSMFEEHILFMPNNFYMLFLTVTIVTPILGENVKSKEITLADDKKPLDMVLIALVSASSIIVPIAIVLFKRNIVAFVVGLIIGVIFIALAIFKILKDKKLLTLLLPLLPIIAISTPIMWFYFDSTNVLHYVLWAFINLTAYLILIYILKTYYLNDYSFKTIKINNDRLEKYLESDIKE